MAKNLRIEAEARTLTPQLHPFSIRGILQNSGFRFRWKTRANGQDYNPSSMSSGVDAGAFNEANTAVYVSSSLAQLLWNSGIWQAKLICEVELFGAYGERFAPRIVTKRLTSPSRMPSHP